MQNRYIEKYTTNDTEIDINENVSVLDILRLLQRITFVHSHSIDLDHQTMIDRDNAFWVVTKMKFVLNNQIKSNQKITLKTWTHKPMAVRFTRDLQIKLKNKLMVKGRSEWCCLDYTTRALRKSNSIKYPNLEMVENGQNKIEFTNLKLDYKDCKFVYTKTIRSSDIDMNNHTNNLKYSVMAMDAFGVDELANNEISEYEIYFVNESRIGDKIDVYRKKFKNLWYIEGVYQDKTIFRSVIKLKKRKN